VILLITQMWLLTATLESYLAGHTDAALPGVLLSAVMLAGCVTLYRFVARLDKAPDGTPERSQAGPWRVG
jgi:hypothetical protein